MRVRGVIQTPFDAIRPVVLIAVGASYCDWRTINLLEAMNRQGMTGKDYVLIVINTQDFETSTTICAADGEGLNDKSALFFDTTTNVLLVC